MCHTHTHTPSRTRFFGCVVMMMDILHIKCRRTTSTTTCKLCVGWWTLRNSGTLFFSFSCFHAEDAETSVEERTNYKKKRLIQTTKRQKSARVYVEWHPCRMAERRWWLCVVGVCAGSSTHMPIHPSSQSTSSTHVLHVCFMFQGAFFFQFFFLCVCLPIVLLRCVF